MPRFKKEDFRFMSATDLCKVMNISSKTLWNWVEEGLTIALDDGTKFYDPKEVMQWKCDRAVKKALDLAEEAEKKKIHERKLSQKEMNGGDTDLDGTVHADQLERYRAAKADLAEDERDRSRKKLINREDHDEIMSEIVDFARSSFQALPKKIGIKLSKERDSSVVEKVLETEIVDVLKGMAKIDDERINDN